MRPNLSQVAAPNVDEILGAIRSRGKRVTGPKRAVAMVLVAADDHLTAEAVSHLVDQHLEDVSPSTVYRILEEFEELGLCEHTHTGHGAAVYHLAGRKHGHITCEDCGRTWEVSSELFDLVSRELETAQGFRLNRHHVALTGQCSECYQSLTDVN